MKKLILSAALVLSAGNLFGFAPLKMRTKYHGEVSFAQQPIFAMDQRREHDQQLKSHREINYRGNTAQIQKDLARYNQLFAKPVRTVAERNEMDILDKKLFFESPQRMG